MPINLPNLKHVGGDLNVTGQLGIEFPLLETVRGNFVIIGTNMKKLPSKLTHVGGDVIFSDKEPLSLVDDLKDAKRRGVIKGNIWCQHDDNPTLIIEKRVEFWGQVYTLHNKMSRM